MKILYVENHPVFAKTVVTQFLSGHEVATVPSVSQARLTLSQAHFDLLLVDYDLDDGKGEELIREIRQLNSKLLIIGVSAHAAGNQALKQAGANAICGKMEFDKIQEVIERVFEHRNS